MVEFTYRTPKCFVLMPFCFHKPTVFISLYFFFFKCPLLFTTFAPLQIDMENILNGFHNKKIIHHHSVMCIEEEKKERDQKFEQLHDILSPFCF